LRSAADYSHMDLNDAIAAHSLFKTRLAMYVAKPDWTLDPRTIEAPNHCEIGKWIYGVGRAFEGWEAFSQLEQVHAQFHKAAAEIVIDANAGEHVLDDVVVGSSSEFAKRSSELVRAILRVRDLARRLPELVVADTESGQGEDLDEATQDAESYAAE